MTGADQGLAPRDATRAALGQGALLVVAILVISGLHYLTPPRYAVLHGIYQRLYYGPVILGAYWFGVRGGLVTALAASLAYIPHIVITWSVNPPYEASQYVEIVMFCAAGLFVGLLADRQRGLTARYQRAAASLERANRELKESHEQLARADRLSALGEMAAGLAHELRNPLAGVNGALEIVASQVREGTPQAEFSGIARKELRRLEDLLNRFLAYARPRTPALRLVSLGELVDHVVALLRPEVERQGVAIDTAGTEPWPLLRVDPEQIEQVLLNVLLNAIQASPRGATVRIRRHEEAGQVIMDIVDEGPGIPEELRARVFQPFVTTKAKGTGLGLAVSARIVNSHGGSIDVRPDPAGGTCVSIRLPHAPEDVSGAPATDRP
jgi:signal transduction histidine kinase